MIRTLPGAALIPTTRFAGEFEPMWLAINSNLGDVRIESTEPYKSVHEAPKRGEIVAQIRDCGLWHPYKGGPQPQHGASPTDIARAVGREPSGARTSRREWLLTARCRQELAASTDAVRRGRRRRAMSSFASTWHDQNDNRKLT
jgi:hypothetical protein